MIGCRIEHSNTIDAVLSWSAAISGDKIPKINDIQKQCTVNADQQSQNQKFCLQQIFHIGIIRQGKIAGSSGTESNMSSQPGFIVNIKLKNTLKTNTVNRTQNMMKKQTVKKVQTTNQGSTSQWIDQPREIRRDEFTCASCGNSQRFDNQGKRNKDGTREQCNACFLKSTSASPARKDKQGHKLFECSECKLEYYQKNHKKDPAGKNCNKCYTNQGQSSTQLNSKQRTAAENSLKRMNTSQVNSRLQNHQRDFSSCDKASFLDLLDQDINTELRCQNEDSHLHVAQVTEFNVSKELECDRVPTFSISKAASDVKQLVSASQSSLVMLELQIQPQKAEGKGFKKPIDLAKPAPSSRQTNSNKDDYREQLHFNQVDQGYHPMPRPALTEEECARWRKYQLAQKKWNPIYHKVYYNNWYSLKNIVQYLKNQRRGLSNDEIVRKLKEPFVKTSDSRLNDKTKKQPVQRLKRRHKPVILRTKKLHRDSYQKQKLPQSQNNNEFESNQKFSGTCSHRSQLFTEMDKINELIKPKELEDRMPAGHISKSARSQKYSDSWLGIKQQEVSALNPEKACMHQQQQPVHVNSRESLKNLLEYKLNAQFECEDKKAPKTDDEKRNDEQIKLNALICNLYRYIPHEPIDQIIEATAQAAFSKNPDSPAEVFLNEQKVAFQELMAEDYRRWGAPADATEKYSFLPTAVHQKYLPEVQKRIDAYKVQERKNEEASTMIKQINKIKVPQNMQRFRCESEGQQEIQLINIQMQDESSPIQLSEIEIEAAYFSQPVPMDLFKLQEASSEKAITISGRKRDIKAIRKKKQAKNAQEMSMEGQIIQTGNQFLRAPSSFHIYQIQQDRDNIKDQDNVRAWTYRQQFWNQGQYNTMMRTQEEQANINKQHQVRHLPPFFHPIITYIPPLSRKQRLLSEHFKVKPAAKRGKTVSEYLKGLDQSDECQQRRARQYESILDPEEARKIDESHTMMQSEEFRLLSMHRSYNELNQQQMLLEKDLREAELREQRLRKIVEEDNPFYYCEHEALLTRIDHNFRCNVHAENSSIQTNNLKSYRISDTDLSSKLLKFDNDCYALKELIKQSIKAVYKHSIRNYGMKDDVETLFKQVKNLRSNSLIYITQLYLNLICQDLDAVVNINVQVSRYRTYKISLQPRRTEQLKIGGGSNRPIQDYQEALASEKKKLARYQEQFGEVDSLLRGILLSKDRFHFFFSMGKHLSSYGEKKEFFEGIIDGVFYVERYAPDLKCECKKENEKRLQEFNEEVRRQQCMLNDRKLVQKEKTRLDRLTEEKEYYVFQNKVVRDFEISKKIGRINSEIEKSFLHYSPKLVYAQCTEKIYRQLISDEALRSYFLVSNGICLRFEINSPETASLLQYFFSENVSRSYEEPRPQQPTSVIADQVVNPEKSILTDLQQHQTAFQDQSDLYAYLLDGQLINVGKACDDQQFSLLIQDLEIPRMRLHQISSGTKALIEAAQEANLSRYLKFQQPVPSLINIDNSTRFTHWLDEESERILFKEDVCSLNLQKVQRALNEMDKDKINEPKRQVRSCHQASRSPKEAKLTGMPLKERLVRERVMVEFMDGQRITMTDYQFDELRSTIERLTAFGRFNQAKGIKQALQTYEKQFEQVMHSFKHISKPVIFEEPLNVSRAYSYPPRKKALE